MAAVFPNPPSANPNHLGQGKNDPFFTEAGAQAYLRDLPEAELRLFDTGHFALEDHASEVAQYVKTFIQQKTK